MGTVELHETIPNNVGLSSDKRLKRALEEWQPHFLAWWREMGPDRFQEDAIYLRTAVSVDAGGWAHFDWVRMPEYRWGIFLAERVPERRIGFGNDFGKPVWQEVPGEHRNTLRRLIVTQGDTEPASVEQQRRLGATCPSLYDLRNLFQVNVEEGRHLWAMAYLLHTYFGRDGREEARALLERRSGNPDKPRILGAFNQPIDDWLSFFMFTTFTDRDGKYQLLALAESGFDPLSRTCRFMLTEEAHHMFVGESGVGRLFGQHEPTGTRQRVETALGEARELVLAVAVREVREHEVGDPVGRLLVEGAQDARLVRVARAPLEQPLRLLTAVPAEVGVEEVDHRPEVPALLDVDLEEVAQIIERGACAPEVALLLDGGRLGVALRDDEPPQHAAVLARDVLPHGPPLVVAEGNGARRLRLGEEDSPAIVGHLEVTELRPALRIHAHRGAQVDVVRLRAVRTHVPPPLEELRLPLLQGALQAAVLAQVDVVRDPLRVVDAGHHTLLRSNNVNLGENRR